MSTPTLQPALPALALPFGPVLLGVLPGTGPTTGGNTVQLIGLGLAGATSVSFGGTSVTIVGQDPLGLTVTVLAPAHAAGAVQVTVTTSSGTSNPATYVYVAAGAPTAAVITPSSGPVAGGTSFVIAGANLQNATVTFGTSTATVLGTDPTGTVLFGVTPAGPPAGGNVPVTVTTPGGTTTVPGGYTYLPPAPAVTGTVTPSTAAAGATFTIVGTNLFGASVLFGAAPAAGVVVNGTGTSLTGVVPPGTSGSTVQVTVQTPGGSANAGSFTYL
ncbi:IPT/TIG domain-containing protein [Streptomyces decoyicus]|uniref:IPT/TIG domain-containing protein n=1 Tax=Streptomyces decoyicus TaxID=249567 RepID=UPI00069EBEEC|nr:IPT/TIG domain-containing protein [Streptomyces decoyicus]KOG38393.1 cell surface receptor IPT/TIG domain-containing protein [Streptomyces decoyicus]QZY16066.1 IPT/TIG domain-containing protein [Streptomyces decoyicus]